VIRYRKENSCEMIYEKKNGGSNFERSQRVLVWDNVTTNDKIFFQKKILNLQRWLFELQRGILAHLV